jgi:hypothetical protein
MVELHVGASQVGASHVAAHDFSQQLLQHELQDDWQQLPSLYEAMNRGPHGPQLKPSKPQQLEQPHPWTLPLPWLHRLQGNKQSSERPIRFNRQNGLNPHRLHVLS